MKERGEKERAVWAVWPYDEAKRAGQVGAPLLRAHTINHAAFTSDRGEKDRPCAPFGVPLIFQMANETPTKAPADRVNRVPENDLMLEWS